MRSRVIKLLLLFLVLVFPQIGDSNSYFVDSAGLSNITVKTSCWVAPSVPTLIYPQNNTYAGAGSTWDLNPYLDWDDSTTSCPLPTTITYQYQSAHDSGFSGIAYNSDWLSNSQIPASGTPEGTYYWHVRAKDNFGNTSAFSDAWLVVVDRTAPTSTIDSPHPNSNVTGSPIHISGTSHDAFGVTNVSLLYSQYVSGACQSSYAPITTLTNSPVANDYAWSYDWIPSLADNYCIKAEATDRAGNKENSPVVENISYRIVSPSASLAFSDANHIVIGAANIANFTSLTYQLTYDTDSTPQGVIGKVDLSGSDHFEKEILLGTCSTDGTCVYHQGVHNFQLTVTLIAPDNSSADLETTL